MQQAALTTQASRLKSQLFSPSFWELLKQMVEKGLSRQQSGHITGSRGAENGHTGTMIAEAMAKA